MIWRMWRGLIEQLYPEATFADGVSEASLSRAERQLGHPVPDTLAAVLRETDGVLDVHGGGLIWPVERIVADNIFSRTDPTYAEMYMPFEPLLFFADAGNGDQFALTTPPVARDDVFVWNHVEDSRTWGAADIGMYLRWWAAGTLTV